MKHAALAAVLLLTATHPRAEVFKEDFSEGLDPRRWTISEWVAPHNGPKNKASFAKDHVKVVNGVLQLKLTQSKNPDGSFTSKGGEITSTRKFGYGTYEFELKASAAEDGKSVSGTITGIFSFLPNSETEIDIEYEGLPSRAHLTQTATWIDENKPAEQVRVPMDGSAHTQFHLYKWVWTPENVKFYRDGKLISTHAKVVPKKEAPVMFNHWGTNSGNWGGLGTDNVTRYVYVKSFTYTSLDVTKK